MSIGKEELCVKGKGPQHVVVLSCAVAPGLVRDAGTGAGEDVVFKTLWFGPVVQNQTYLPPPII